MFQYDELVAAGFTGFKTVKQMREGGLSIVPQTDGIYVILYLNPSPAMPKFLAVGTGGYYEGKEPNVSVDTLKDNWVDDTPFIYIGKSNNIRRRLREYMRFGEGKDVCHFGGRFIWQIPSSENLVVCWKPTQEDSRIVEARLIQEFIAGFGKRPFANLQD